MLIKNYSNEPSAQSGESYEFELSQSERATRKEGEKLQKQVKDLMADDEDADNKKEVLLKELESRQAAGEWGLDGLINTLKSLT